MQSSAVTAPRTLRLDLASPAQRQALISRLSQGQAVQARVQDRLPDGRWTIRLMGHTLTAESRQHLLSGQLVQAKVESLGPPLLLSLTGGLVAEDAALGRALRSLDLPDDRVNRTILGRLMSHGSSVDRSVVQSLRDLLGALSMAGSPEQLDRQIAAILMLRGRGIPVTPDAVAGFLGSLPQGELGGLIAAVAGFLESLRRKSPDLARRIDVDAAGRLLSQLPADPESLDGNALRTLVARLGIDTEGRLATEGHSAAAHLSDDTLRPELLRLIARLQLLERTALSGADRSALDTLLGRLGELRLQLDTMQAVSLPSRDAGGLHLQIPLHADGAIATADIRIADPDDAGRRPIDPDNVRLRIDLDLSGLGRVHIGLAVTNRQAACTIHVDDSARTQFLSGAAEELRQALQACGYAAPSVFVRNRTEKESGDRPRTIGIDVRA